MKPKKAKSGIPSETRLKLKSIPILHSIRCPKCGWEVFVETVEPNVRVLMGDFLSRATWVMTPEEHKTFQSIRTLIEKVFEWQKMAGYLLDGSPLLERLTNSTPLKKFVMEIRDFGKEEK